MQKNYQKNTMYVDEIKYFLKCLRKRENTINGIEDGIRTLQIALAIKRASKIKKNCKTMIQILFKKIIFNHQFS